MNNRIPFCSDIIDYNINIMGSIIKVGVPADRQRKKERAYPKKSDIM